MRVLCICENNHKDQVAVILDNVDDPEDQKDQITFFLDNDSNCELLYMIDLPDGFRPAVLNSDGDEIATSFAQF